MSFPPLLILSEARIQEELRSAAAMAAEATAYRRRRMQLLLTRIDWVAGSAVIAFGLMSGDVAHVLFWAALLRALCGPVGLLRSA